MPERSVRSVLRQMGIGYRLRLAALPGKPDIAMIGRKTAIFVHGCFWHQHKGCKRACVPSSNTQYWIPKLAANKRRDKTAIKKLKASGWTTVTIWECETGDAAALTAKLAAVLGNCARE